MNEPRHRNLVIFTAVWLAAVGCRKPDTLVTTPVPDAGLDGRARLLSIGPRLLSNQTSQPVSVLGERLTPGASLRLGAPINRVVPLTVLDSRHAYARLPGELPLGNASETLVPVTLVGGVGEAALRFIGDTTFPDFTASAPSGDGTHLFVVSGPEDTVYDVDLTAQTTKSLPVGDGPTAVAIWLDEAKHEWVVVAHQFTPQVWLVPVAGGDAKHFEAPANVSGLVVDAKRQVVFLAEQARDSVVALSLLDGHLLWRTKVAANPRELVMTSKGLIVGSLQTGELQRLDAATGQLGRSFEPTPGTAIVGGHTATFAKYVMNGTAVRDLAWSERLQRLFVSSIGPNIGPNPQKMEVSMNGGVAAVDLNQGFLRHLGFGAGVTEALALDEARGLLYASDVSLGQVRVLDAKKLGASDASASKALLQVIDVPPLPGFARIRDEADFDVNGRAGVSLHSGPKTLALSGDGKTLWVVNRYTGSIAKIDVTPAPQGKAVFTSQFRVVDTLGQPTRRLGQVLYFADLGRTAMSCDACHVEGHTEGVLFEKTMPLRIYRSPTVRGSRETPPYFTPASTHSMGETMKVVGSRNRFHNPNLNPTEIEALTLFGSTIATLPNPFVGADGAPVEQLELPDGAVGHPRSGLALFEGKAQCVSCHPGPHFTLDQDPATRARYLDVGTPHFMPLRESFQNTHFEGFATPALTGAWDVFPMLSTGLAGLEVTPDERVVVNARFPLRVAVERWAPQHGRADLLTTQERNDLLAYVMSL